MGFVEHDELVGVVGVVEEHAVEGHVDRVEVVVGDADVSIAGALACPGRTAFGYERTLRWTDAVVG
ncbi:MAG TPA: hypothetical protein QGF43_07340, partial [Acidimicrobiales bacterium]|nr:hypothetical protein [Acidimicrobiales bacterium]